MAALTRIRNNQVDSHSIHANKIQLNTITGELFANNLIYDGTLTVSNLQVYGNSTVINSVNTTISDAVIELNAEYTGAPTFDTGVIFGRGASENVGLIWNEYYQYFHMVFTPTTANSAPGTIAVTKYADLHIGNLNLYGDIIDALNLNAVSIDLSQSASISGNINLAGNLNTSQINGADSLTLSVYGNPESIYITNDGYVTEFKYTGEIKPSGALIGGDTDTNKVDVTNGPLSLQGMKAGAQILTSFDSGQSGTYVWNFSNLGTLDAPGNVTVTGNVAADYFIGDGSLLSNMYSNTEVGAYLPTDITITDIQANVNALFDNAAIQSANIDSLWSNAAIQDLEISNIITGTTTLDSVTTTYDANIGGNVNTSNWINTTNISLTGSLFANANAGAIGQYLASDGTNAYWASHFFNGALPPDVPNYGDIWYYIDENKLYMWVSDGGSDFWYDFLPPTF